MNKSLLLMFPVLLILLECSGGESAPAQLSPSRLNGVTTQPASINPSYYISLKKTRTFGSSDEHLVSVRGWGSVITDKKNRVYIPDSQTNDIHVFNAAGRYITQMGGEGKGPGEYLHMSDFQITSNYLYIYGRTLFKITVYSLKDLSYSHTILLNKESWGNIKRLNKRTVGHDFFVTDEGKILMSFNYVSEFDPEQWEREGGIKNHTVQWYWLNYKGVLMSDMVFEQQRKRRHVIDGWGSKMTMTFDFFGEPLRAVTKKGTIATAWSNEFEISLYYSDGKPKNVITFPFEKVPLNREILIEDYKRRFNNRGFKLKPYKTMDLPGTWPALNQMFFDDQNRLWIAAIVPDLSVYKWFIFDIEGQLMACIKWPRDKPIQEVNNNFMYTIEDNKQGIREVVRYKIVMDQIKD